MAGQIQVNNDTFDPNKAWLKMSVKQTVKGMEPLPLDTPIRSDAVRFVCLSDTHNQTGAGCFPPIPKADVLLHAGDFTNKGAIKDIEKFNTFLGTLTQVKHKVVIAGNHDLLFDDDFLNGCFVKHMKQQFQIDACTVKEQLEQRGVNSPQELLTNCIYLQDSGIQLYGINIYGSPWQPEFYNWAFNLKRGEECLSKWNLIPDDVDVLMTHGPPIGYGDKCHMDGNHAGCVELLSTIQKRVKPKYHISGHIHEGYGMLTDGQVTYINASTCTLQYKPVNPPIIFDFPLGEGYLKSHYQELIVIHPQDI